MTIWRSTKLKLVPIADTSKQFFVRIKGNAEEMKEALENSFGPVEIIRVDGLDGEFGFVTGTMTEKEYAEKAGQFEDILHMIRLEG